LLLGGIPMIFLCMAQNKNIRVPHMAQNKTPMVQYCMYCAP